MRTCEEVVSLFHHHQPGGGTKLAKVLDDAVKPDTFEAGKRRPETILVITDGEPSDRDAVERVIINATKQHMRVDEDLSITFIQVGNDKEAAAWLTKLDDDLEAHGARFDCVDCMSFEDMQGTSFTELVRLSIQD